ncbi:hypothetical protein SpAn4DRAFT_2636 [Sporomusa ovata]|uniref:Uncharacterized protein n=1 Tax=Sporomusa ovata TaxID=2378 RepID=A0A0U1L3B7_9FIRM|nr:hypothetical protein SpAn4DRAFT_2636 [Sporomusa ovata]
MALEQNNINKKVTRQDEPGGPANYIKLSASLSSKSVK